MNYRFIYLFSATAGVFTFQQGTTTLTQQISVGASSTQVDFEY